MRILFSLNATFNSVIFLGFASKNLFKSPINEIHSIPKLFSKSFSHSNQLAIDTVKSLSPSCNSRPNSS
jgi:hypothetical protein